MFDKRMFWILPACLALAACAVTEPTPIAEAVPQAEPFKNQVGLPPARLISDETDREPDVVFVSVNGGDGTITVASAAQLAAAEEDQIIITTALLDDGMDCTLKKPDELACETDEGIILIGLVTTADEGEGLGAGALLVDDFMPAFTMAGIDQRGPVGGVPVPDFATPRKIGDGVFTLAGNGGQAFGGDLPAAGLSDLPAVTQTFGAGVASPTIPGVYIFPNLPVPGFAFD